MAITTMLAVLNSGNPSMQLSVSITEDLVFEPTEHFNLSISTTSDGCTIPDPIVDVYIMDDGETIYIHTYMYVRT